VLNQKGGALQVNASLLNCLYERSEESAFVSTGTTAAEKQTLRGLNFTPVRPLVMTM
jgi:hypothetical protein